MIDLPLPVLLALAGVLFAVVVAGVIVALLPEKPGRRDDDPEE